MNKNIIYFAIVAIIFGSLGGIFGNLLNRTYWGDNFYGLPFSSEIDISDTGISKSNVVIEGAKKLIVEQDKRVKETRDSIKKSMVSIFPAKDIQMEQKSGATSTVEQAIVNDQYYRSGEEEGAGLIVTGDGWILTNTFTPDKPESEIKKDYRVITPENKIKEIDRAIKDKKRDITFLHLKEARDLPAVKLADPEKINNGEIAIAANKGERTLMTNIVEKTSPEGLVRSSDKMKEELILSHQLNNYYNNDSFLFNLDEELVGLQTSGSDNTLSITQFHPSISSLLKFEEIKTPTLGVRYIDLSEMVMSKKYPRQGALLYSAPSRPAIIPGTPAEDSKLQAGDIITAVNNKKINKENKLPYLVHDHLPGDNLVIHYQRGGEEYQTKITLE